MDTLAWIAKEAEYCAPNYHPLPVVLSHGKGQWLWDINGKRYLDMMSAYSAVSHGHGHPRLLAALKKQADSLCIPSRAFHHNQLLPFLEKLCALSNMEMALPMNTGAEAVETAIKAVRRWAYRVKGVAPDQAEIIVADGNFHGRTVTITSFSTDPEYQSDFGPFTPGFVSVPFGDAEALENAITPNTAAFLVEPMQGEAGIIVPPEGWLRQVAQICKKNNVLLVLDEIQTGLGRTGAWFAHQHEKIQPDGLILGKALGGGMMPVSAFLASKEVLSLITPGAHGSTFGGNPLACAVGLEALKVIEDEGLVEHSRLQGEAFLRDIAALKHDGIREVRGKGLWVALECEPERLSARTICESLLSAGILAKEVHENVVRFAPPLVIEAQDIALTTEALAAILEKMP